MVEVKNIPHFQTCVERLQKLALASLEAVRKGNGVLPLLDHDHLSPRIKDELHVKRTVLTVQVEVDSICRPD